MINLKQLSNIPRYSNIATALVKHGFVHVAEHLGLSNLYTRMSHLTVATPEPEIALTLPQRLRSLLQDLGPTFIKLGQILATRRDLLPEEFVEEFAKLQDDVPPMGYDKVRLIFMEETGSDPLDLFAEFEEEPIAAASIGQVHRARLKEGQEVAIKVQRHGIASIINSDIDILYSIAQILHERDIVSPVYDLVGIVDEFAKSIRMELDYRREIQNLRTFTRNFQGDPTVTFPRVYPELSTSRILCMEFIRGTRSSQFRTVACNPEIVARNGAEAILKMTFRDGIFHGDPHPGNLFILDNDVICFMDFGVVGRLSPKMRDSISRLLFSLISRDYDILARELVTISEPLDEVNYDSLAMSLMEALDHYHGAPLRDIDLSGLFRSISRLLRRYRLKLPSNYALMLKSLASVEGLGKLLHPDFDITEYARPYVERMVIERWAPSRVAHDFELLAMDGSTFFRKTPMLFLRILNKLQRGNLSLEVGHKGSDVALQAMERVFNRVAFSLVISALLISSSVIMVLGGGSEGGVPLSAILGYTLALLLSAWVLLGVLRSGGP